MKTSVKTRLRVSGATVAIVFFGLAVIGCGSADEGGDTTAPPPAPGTVTLDVSGITDAMGLVMLSLIGKDVPGQGFAAVCDVVDAEPFNSAGAYLPITGDEPCALGTEPVMFDPGHYEIVVAVLPGGSTTPEQCTMTDVTVDGDVVVKVTGLGPGTDCDF